MQTIINDTDLLQELLSHRESPDRMWLIFCGMLIFYRTTACARLLESFHLDRIVATQNQVIFYDIGVNGKFNNYIVRRDKKKV